MDSLWQAAFAIAGISGIASFVLFGLYKEWLSSPAFSTLTKSQRFSLLKLFLILTFVFALSGLGLSAFEKMQSNAPAKTSNKELQKVLLSRLKSGKEKFSEALNDPMISLDPPKKTRLEAIESKYELLMRDAVDALERNELNLYHEKINHLNELLYSQDFKDLLPDAKPTLITDSPITSRCDGCV